MRGRHCPVEGSAARHHVDLVVVDVGPDALPQHLDRPLGTIFGQDAGTAEFEETVAGMARDQLLQLEFAFRIEAAGRGASPAAAAGRCRRCGGGRVRAARIEDQQVVADLVEAVGVAPLRRSIGLFGPELIIEDPIADFLRRGDFGVARKAHFQRADAAERDPARRLLDSVAAA